MSFSVGVEWHKIVDALIFLLIGVYTVLSVLLSLWVWFELSGLAGTWYMFVAVAPMLYHACETVVSDARESHFPPNKRPLVRFVKKMVPIFYLFSPIFSVCSWLTLLIQSTALVFCVFSTMLFLHAIPFLILHVCTVEETTPAQEVEKVPVADTSTSI